MRNLAIPSSGFLLHFPDYYSIIKCHLYSITDTDTTDECQKPRWNELPGQRVNQGRVAAIPQVSD